MKEQTYFHIPAPCHENWDNMTPEGRGRFCASCSKQVVDFSLMSDQQVLNHFKNTTGKVCGRFADDQLQRPMVAAAEQKKKIWWVAAMMPMLLLFGKANAQKKRNITLGTPAMVVPDKRPEIMGKVAPGIRTAEDTISVSQDVIITGNCWGSHTIKMIIKGIVTDESGKPVPFASIRELESFANTTTDSSGNFELSLKKQLNDKINIETSSIGYENNISEVLINQNNNISIILKQKEALLPNVTVTAGDYYMRRTAGGICIVRKVTYYNLLDTSWKKIFRNEAFKIFPNPVVKGGSLNIEVTKVGNYALQLLDGNSRPVLIKEFITASDKSVIEITIPSSVASGIYYICLIDEKKKKQYTDKLIVQ
jgi:hypothetical protein